MNNENSSNTNIVAPYGGTLVDLNVPHDQVESVKQYAKDLPSIQLSERSICDLELLATGAFSPLDRFMGRKDHKSVLDDMRLASGHIFPIPITLPVDPQSFITEGNDITLRDSKNNLLGLMTIEEVYEWDHSEVSEKVFGTLDPQHQIVSEMFRWGKYNISGPIRVLALPRRYDFETYRLTPAQTRSKLKQIGNVNVVAFQTRNPLHRVHEELTKRAAKTINGTLLIHPSVGLTKTGDVDHYTRVRSYIALTENYYANNSALLTLLPLAMRMGGPREALWHAVIRRNYGANHMIVGRDHAGPGSDSNGRPFYGPYDAQDLVVKHENELRVTAVPFQELVFLPNENRYEEISKIPSGTITKSISGTDVREKYLKLGKSLPDWFTRPEVAKIMADTYPPRHQHGACIWFTGLSGSGKTTTAEVLTVLIMEHGRQVSLLDGDVIRTNLSKGLGFSKEDRDTNIRRIGYVAAEIVQHGGLVICAAVSPYRTTRDDVRRLIGGEDQFIEIFVDTPLSVCEERDVKGMYAKARKGEIKDFTGIDDPYEPPANPEMKLNTIENSPEKNARSILGIMKNRGLIRTEQ